MTNTFITKFRPDSFEDVIGQDPVVRSLKDVVKRKSSQTFLFTGPSGVGKTTLARILARALGCTEKLDLEEVDVATKTGVDDIRLMVESLRYRPLGKGAMKAVILNESHQLSKQGWNSLLMELEEPKDYVVWALCTTEPTRIPAAIRTRCTCYDLKPVKFETLAEWLDSLLAKEKLKLAPEIVDACADAAQGSPRQALANLTACLGAKDIAEAEGLLKVASIDNKEAIDLARALVRKAPWREIQGLLSGLQEMNPESVRHVVRSYLTKAVLNAKQEQAAGRTLEILDCFSEPFNSSDGVTPLLIACGKAVL